MELLFVVCCVHTCHVVLQGPHLLSTDGACGLLSVGLLHVTLYVDCRIKLTTVLTGDLFFVSRCLVIVQPFPGGKYLRAYVALNLVLVQRHFSMHCVLVVFQLVAIGKCLETQWTFNWERWSMLPLYVIKHSFFCSKIFFTNAAKEFVLPNFPL